MPSCKYCGQPLNWLNNNGKFTPLNAADGSVHQCQKRPAAPQQTNAQYQQQRQTYAAIPQAQPQPQIDLSEITRRLDAIMSKCLQIESMVKNCMPYTPLDEPAAAQQQVPQ